MTDPKPLYRCDLCKAVDYNDDVIGCKRCGFDEMVRINKPDEAAAPVWTYRWYGSPTEKGWTILQGRETVAYIGGDESMGDAVHDLVEAHNRSIR
jgi:hypothetical protein